MPNDLTTLMGSLVEAKDQLIYQLGQKGVTATFDPTTGLEGLIAHIADIQGGGEQTLTLLTTKTILSHADNDQLTIYAIIGGSGTKSGQTITFYKNNTSIGTATTDTNGIATLTYNSTGAGDITLKAGQNTLESNSILIEDCLLYADTTKISSWTTSGIIQYSNYTIPDNSSVTWKFSNNLNNIRVGIGNGDGQYVTVWYKNPSSYQTHRYTYMYYTTSQTLKETVTDITTDDTVTVKLQGSTATWYKNDVQQDTGSISTTLTRNVRLVDYTTYTVEYVKIKPIPTS